MIFNFPDLIMYLMLFAYSFNKAIKMNMLKAFPVLLRQDIAYKD